MSEEPKPKRKPGRPPKPKPFGPPKPPPDRPQSQIPNGLTPSQEAYCRARAMGMSPQEALKAIGEPFSPKTAWHLERHDERIINRIAELSKLATDNAILRTGLTREWVIGRLMTVVERCMQEEPVFDREGNPTGEFRFDSTGANSALKMLGDTMGLFKPVEKKQDDDYANLSDHDLARIAAELAQATGAFESFARIETSARSQQTIDVQAVPQAVRVS